MKGEAVFEKLRKSFSGAVDKISKTKLNGKKLDSTLSDFKLILLENDVALSVADQICESLKEKLEGVKIDRFKNPKETVKKNLKETLTDILTTEKRVDLLETAADKKKKREPFVIVFVGINGSGKTTSIAKVAKLLLNQGYSVVLACSDTYRAGSIEQLEEHAKRLGVRMIKHRYGADAAAVAFDAVKHAEARGVNVVLVDTAGRMETDKNLMMELEKIKRVVNPDLVMFVGDALTGNDAVAQAEEFDKFVHIDASILAKADADAKGGAAISIAHVTKKPIIYLGTGQRYEDLTPFEPGFLIEMIFD